MNIWRLNIKTAAKPGVNPRQFCFTNGVLGAGWPIDSNQAKVNWKTYREKASAKYDNSNSWKTAVKVLHDRMEVDDLCWTRDRDGIYYLGRILSDWKYKNEKEYLDADVVNVRSCDWKRIGEVDAVPGKVVNSFMGGGRTVQAVNRVGIFSKYAYNKATGEPIYDLSKSDPNLFSLLQYDDYEDVIGLYLQDRGYRLIPSSCKKGTVAYEYVMKHRETGRKAFVQVKSGADDLDFGDYQNLDGDIFLFTAHGKYKGEPDEGSRSVEGNEIRTFMYKNRDALPDKVQAWLEMHELLQEGEA